MIYCRLADRLLLEPERRMIEKLYGQENEELLERINAAHADGPPDEER